MQSTHASLMKRMTFGKCIHLKTVLDPSLVRRRTNVGGEGGMTRCAGLVQWLPSLNPL